MLTCTSQFLTDTDEDISGGLNMVMTEHLLREAVPWLLAEAGGGVVAVPGDVLRENTSWFLVKTIGRVLVVAVVAVSRLHFPVVGSVLTEDFPNQERKQESN